jgi:hypothetical protein
VGDFLNGCDVKERGESSDLACGYVDTAVGYCKSKKDPLNFFLDYLITVIPPLKNAPCAVVPLSGPSGNFLPIYSASECGGVRDTVY